MIQSATKKGTINRDEEAVKLHVLGMATVGIQLAGTFVGTLQFEGSIDGATWVALDATPVPTDTSVSSATGEGVWILPVAGLAFVRVRASAWTSGTATVYQASIQSGAGSAGGAGGGASTVDGTAFTADDTPGTIAMGVYEATPSTVIDGDAAAIGIDESRNVKTREQYAPGYEDNVNNVAKVEQRYSYSPVAAADVQVKASPGFLHTVTFSCNDAAPTAGSIIIYDSTAESGSQVFNHTFTTTPFLPFTVILDYTMNTGIYIGFTTTADVNVSCSYR